MRLHQALLLLAQKREMLWRINLLSIADLKVFLHRDFGRRDKLLIVLASFEEPCQIKDIQERARHAGFRIPGSWNSSATLARTKGLAVRTHNGWEITDAGKQHLANIGVTKVSSRALQVATDLRAQLLTIKSDQTRSFLEEAIGCYEAAFYRAAIIMSWVGALSVLYEYICSNHLARFNAEARRMNSKWREAKTTDDLTRMRERDFLDRIANISVISRDTRKALGDCLDRRNSCGHPNSLRLRENTAAHHVEVLLLNVFTVYQ